jgi:hypothetical protein
MGGTVSSDVLSLGHNRRLRTAPMRKTHGLRSRRWRTTKRARPLHRQFRCPRPLSLPPPCKCFRLFEKTCAGLFSEHDVFEFELALMPDPQVSDLIP